MKIGLPWTAVIAELRFIESPAGTETAEVTGVVKATVMILAPKKWLFEVILGLAGAALAAATVQDWQCLNYYSSLLISVKT